MTDPDTGLVYLRARDYDPFSRQFVSVDPVVDSSGQPYAYAGNSPLGATDPSGLWGEELAFNAASFFAGVVVGVADGVTFGMASEVLNAWVPGFECVTQDNPFYGAGNLTGQIAVGVAMIAAGGAGLGVIAGTLARVGVKEGTRLAAGALARSAKAVASTVKSGLGGVARAVGKARGGTSTAAEACSFAGATVVLMSDGSEKPIDTITVGDTVVASDAESGEQAPKAVRQVFVHEDTIYDLVLGDGTVIATTEDHPFWSATDQAFERADQLEAGELVLTADGTLLPVQGIEAGTQRTALAYNLAVEGIHTYHVGAAHVLVHNTCSYINMGSSKSAVRNIGTDTGHTDFQKSLIEGGWKSREVAGGKATLFEMDGRKYSLRAGAKTYDGWTAEYTPAGASTMTLKLRLGYGAEQ